MPSPPPPYTPPSPICSVRPQVDRHSSITSDELYTASPLITEQPWASQGGSRVPSQVQNHPDFPPPPSTQSNGVQHDRESFRNRFSLSTMAAKVKRTDAADSPPYLNSPVLGSVEMPLRPPAGRRAISAGGAGLLSGSNTVQSYRRESPEASRWEPGMPLPPPPPGPPPSTSVRSQSLNRYAPQRPTEISGNVSGDPQRANPRPPVHSNTLGAIPPTPVDWVDDDLLPHNHEPSLPQLRINTGAISPSVDKLSRRPAIRDPSANSILERRSMSRSGRDSGGQGQFDQSSRQVLPEHASATIRQDSDSGSSTLPPLQPQRFDEQPKEREGVLIGNVNPSTTTSVKRQGETRDGSILTPPYTPGPDHLRHHGKQRVINSPKAVSKDVVQNLFVQSSLERFQMFIQQEASSPTDRVRLEVFANFMVQESRIRRDRYSTAFYSMAGEIMDLTRDMWRPTEASKSIAGSPALINTPQKIFRLSASPDSSRASASAIPTSSCSSISEPTPATDTESIYDESERRDDRPSIATWADKFHPSLSPIQSVPSMAATTVPDDDGSRGRSASRWWEGSAEGSVGHGARKLAMTKQETKYMSLHPQELFAPAQPSPSHSTPTPRTADTSFTYGPDQYPLEKAEMDEEQESADPSGYYTEPTPRLIVAHGGKQSIAHALDISRLVTLPPSYPRHYPALHNDHPSLSGIRAKHREITRLIGNRQSQPQTDPCWQPSAYAAMISTAETSIAELVRRLDDTAHIQHTISAQTEGDERPELLEKLTLLKWIFEAREQLQKQEFDRSMQRIQEQSQAFTDQCRSCGDHQRAYEEVEQLNRYTQQSQQSYAGEAAKRFTQLLDIVQKHVNHGVEVQLSAFWDIAPALLEIVQKIPVQERYALFNLPIQIPSNELDDNPSYRQFPLQYLLHMLTHAKKSAYQFIESQTNLLCLLHEVRTASMSAEVRVAEITRIMRGENVEGVRQEMAGVRRRREGEETGVLKERVGCLEGQWEDALGEEIEKVIEAVSSILKESGGWEEDMDD